MDILCITTTINKKTNIIRRNNLIDKFSTFNIPVILNHGLVKKSVNHDISLSIVKNSLNIFMKTKYDYAIVCDDDFDPVDNFMEELNATINILPENWRCLHLCPGYLWGRRFRDKTKIGRANPEKSLKDIQQDPSGRVYLTNKQVYKNRKMWLGGPVAFVVNKNAGSLLTDFINESKNPKPADVILTLILNEHDYVCKEPLGYENEQGGSTLKAG
jgi:hypothetical protein